MQTTENKFEDNKQIKAEFEFHIHIFHLIHSSDILQCKIDLIIKEIYILYIHTLFFCDFFFTKLFTF